MAKTPEHLIESRAAKEILQHRYGFVPRSVLGELWTTKTIKLYTTYADLKKKSEWAGTPFEVSIISERSKGATHSDFPHTVARWLLRFLLPEKTEEPGHFGNHRPVVLDPFSGHNSRMEDCYRLGYNYIGYDVSHTFMEGNRKIREMLLSEPELFPDGNPVLELHEADSRTITGDCIADAVITSPPFWDIEYYGPESAQLHNCRLYSDFIRSLGDILERCLIALKPGGWAIVETNDIRKDGVLYPYHADTIVEMQRRGFVLHDMVIVDYRRAFLNVFLLEVEQQKIMPKVHSYFIVAKRSSNLSLKTLEQVKVEVMESGSGTKVQKRLPIYIGG